jgi:hypothetical protein
MNFEMFTNSLTISFKGFKELPYISPNITYLDCSNNQIEEIKNLPNNIIMLNCSFNPLKNLDFIKNSNLKILIMEGVKYVNLDYIPNSLEILDCRHCHINKLPELKNIKILKCKGNKLRELSLNNNITYIDASKNKIEKINHIPESLQYIDLSFNKIKSLPKLHEKINLLNLESNPLDIENLPILPSSFIFFSLAKNVFKNVKDIENHTLVKFLNGYEFSLSTNLTFFDIENIDIRKNLNYQGQYICDDLVEFEEYDMYDYLNKSLNNIVIEVNDKFYCYKRNELRKHGEIENNQIHSTVSGETLIKLYMREYVNSEEFNFFQDNRFSVYKLTFKKNIEFNSNVENVYSICPYQLKDFLLTKKN